ncbi:MAG TPA: flagellar hook protein FlgE [Halomonas campaniensis]|uniref:Flagellar hook protein FlgE n=1 Tax=Halomonas campaniensis TaxID=213554 RepID=A0A3D0KE92_9GAMM|nr:MULTISPECIES: flagellar hook protein FlgE [unclassified Halomonas]HBS83579.1 flagellar hook protein FlgE [Halomonas campaniensis]HCA01521.1 flagellar hook protein FlgE [Halomonas campaniensis]
MSFTTAVAGLNAQSEKLNSAGNNIANSQTVGYKRSDVLFSDVFAASRGIGVQVSDVRQNFTQGSIESTGRNLDLAISGEGFYRLERPTGEVGYSRNGEFGITAAGDIVNAQGDRLMGYGMDRGITVDTDDQQAFPFSNVLVGGAPQALNVPVDDIPAKATTEVNALLNLDARVVSGQDLNTVEISESDADAEANPPVVTPLNYHFSNNFTSYDSLGNAVNVATYFERVGDNSNQWNVTAVTNGVTRGSFTLDFTQSGRLQTNAQGVVTGIGESANPGGAVVTEDPETDETRVTIGGIPGGVDAAALDIQFKFNGSTQFAADSLQKELNQDGFTSGALAGITVTETGVIQRNFTNGETRAAGQIALASFRNEEGLQPLGNNLWAATNTSGLENLGAPGTGRLGQIQAEAVEASNVDLASELVDTIVAQRSYQANSNTISTQDELLQTIINL